MVKILALGNEFIKEDSFAKKISKIISKEINHKIINIKDSFQFLDSLNSKEKIIILDVVKNLKEPLILKNEDLQDNQIISAHDMDAGFILKLINPNVKIIGIPQNSKKQNTKDIIKKIHELIKEQFTSN